MKILIEYGGHRPPYSILKVVGSAHPTIYFQVNLPCQLRAGATKHENNPPLSPLNLRGEEGGYEVYFHINLHASAAGTTWHENKGTLTLTLSPHGARELVVLFSNVPSPPRSGGDGQGEGAFDSIFILIFSVSNTRF